MKRYAKKTALALAMALTVTSVAPATANAATKPSFKKSYSVVKKGSAYAYTVKNIKKGTKVKWTIIGTGKSYVSFNKSKDVNKEYTKAASTKTYSTNKIYIRKNTTKVVKAVVRATVTGANGKKYTVSDKIAVAKKTVTPATTAPATKVPTTTAPVTTGPATTAPTTTAPVTTMPVPTGPATELPPTHVPPTHVPTGPATTAPVTEVPVTTAPVTGVPTGPATTAPVATTAPAVTATPSAVTYAAVSAVEVLNLKEVKVTFKEALTDKQALAAEKVDNYAVYLSGATTTTAVTKVTVASDKKSAILLLSGTFVNLAKANKVVVKSAIGLEKDYTAENLESKDNLYPQVSTIEAVGNKVIKIHFSEAVQSYSAAEIQTAASYTVTPKGSTTAINAAGYTAVLSADLRTVTLTFADALGAGTYSVGVKPNIVKDFSNTQLLEVSKEVTVTNPVAKTNAVSVAVKSRTIVEVTFDQAVTANDGATLTWKQGTVSKDTTTKELIGNNILRFTFADSNVIAAGLVDFTVTGVADAYGATVNSTTFTGQTIEAEAAATAVATVTDDDTLVVTFSKAMQSSIASDSTVAGDAANKANYVIKDSKGATVDLTTVTATYTNTDSVYKVTLTKAAWNLNGNYTVTVKDVKDAYGTAMTTLTDAGITVKDTTRPTVADSASYSVTSKNISISFSEAMATSGSYSVLDLLNYQYSTDGTTYAAFPTGTTVTASSDAKTVIITLPSSATVNTTCKIKIGYVATSGVKTVADSAGNILTADGTSSGTYTKDLTMAEDTAAAINYAGATKVKDATTLLVPVTGTFGSVDAADFQYTVDGTTYKAAKSVELTTIDGTQYIVLGLNDTLTAKTVRTNVAVRLNQTSGYTFKSKTALGTLVAAATTETTDISATLAAWPFRATIQSAEVLNSTTIKVTFDGLPATTNLEKFLEVVNGTSAAAAPTAVTLDGDNSILLTVAAIDTTKSTTIKTKLYNAITPLTDWAKDGNGVYYAENTTGVTATNATALGIVSVVPTLTNATVAATNKIEITFNQTIDPATIKSAWDGTVDAAATVDIDANGKLTVDDYAIGSIEGFTVNAAKSNMDAKIAYDGDARVLTITFDAADANVLVNGKLKYTPNTAITDSFANKISTASKETATKLDAKPIVYTASTSADKTQVTVNFSEAMDTTTFTTGLGGTVTFAANGGAGVLDATTPFTWSADKKTVVIKFSTAMSGVEAIDFAIGCKDSTGTAMAAKTLTATAGVITQ